MSNEQTHPLHSTDKKIIYSLITKDKPQDFDLINFLLKFDENKNLNFIKTLDAKKIEENITNIDTEEKIINSIQNIQIGITIIMIAHRKSTLKNCDKIFEVKDNRLLINSG